LETSSTSRVRTAFQGWLKTMMNELMADLKEDASCPPTVGETLLAHEEAGPELLERLAAGCRPRSSPTAPGLLRSSTSARPVC
jgi:hypothetical protein